MAKGAIRPSVAGAGNADAGRRRLREPASKRLAAARQLWSPTSRPTVPMCRDGWVAIGSYRAPDGRVISAPFCCQPVGRSDSCASPGSGWSEVSRWISVTPRSALRDPHVLLTQRRREAVGRSRGAAGTDLVLADNAQLTLPEQSDRRPRDVQPEKLWPSAVNSSSIACWPLALRQAPRTLTGSLWDQSDRRGAESPLCSASSASYRSLSTHLEIRLGRSGPPHARSRGRHPRVRAPDRP